MGKKHRLLIIILAVVVLLSAGAAAILLYLRQAQVPAEELYQLNVSAEAEGNQPYFGSVDSGISFTVTNNSYIPVQIREVMLLSVYDSHGQPLSLDGSAYTPSSAELTAETGLVKAICGGKGVFVAEYGLDAGKTGNALCRQYALELCEEYKGNLFRLDVLILGKPQQYPYSDWELLTVCNQVIDNQAEDTLAEKLATGQASLPALTGSNTYHWELGRNCAQLVDIGSVQEADIIIPAKVWLTKTADGYVEDPICGTCYDVQVKGDAFAGHKTLETVTFEDGVCVEYNAMNTSARQGMFTRCTSLKAVYNIPDTVTSMASTFSGCTSLEQMPELPPNVENLFCCFQTCYNLTQLGQIPQTVTDMAGCFQLCTSLQTTPLFPEHLKDLSETFSGCDALETVQPLPKSLERLDKTFSGCISLTQAPILPDSIISMEGTFEDCTAIASVENLPASVVNMQDAFRGCSNLQRIPEIPNQCILLDGCFYACQNLIGDILLPESIFSNSIVPAQLKDTFYGCDSLGDIYADTCKNKGIDYGTTPLSLVFTRSHTSGFCENCHYANGSFDGNGITVVMDNIPDFVAEGVLEYVRNKLPQSLKQYCPKLTFTPNWSHDPLARGICYYPSGNCYVRYAEKDWLFDILDPSKDQSGYLQSRYEADVESYLSVACHELGHAYDTKYSTNYYHSHSSEWQQICLQEGSILSSRGDAEAFANAVATYFFQPEQLQQDAPRSYAFVDALFQ